MTLQRLKYLLMACLAITVAGVSMSATAAKSEASTKKHDNITSMWILWVKDGQYGKFETALKQYVAWRKSNNDPFEWHIYKPIAGRHLDYYVARSGGHTWADIQKEVDWEQAHRGADGGTHLSEYVSHEAHYYTAGDNQHSHWIPNKDYKYFGVTNYQVKSGADDSIRADLDKIQKAVKQAKWPYPYGIEYIIGGHGGMSIAIPMASMTDMARPKPSLMEVMTRSLGSKKAASDVMHDFSSGIKSRDFTLYEYMPDLGSK